jgi:hypothetical protein
MKKNYKANIRFMKYLPILFLLFGCYTQKKATNQVNKAQLSYPNILAQKCKDLYPCKLVSYKKDSTEYFEFMKAIEDLNNFYLSSIGAKSDTVTKLDTILVYKNCPKAIIRYRELIKNIPAIHDTVKIVDEAELVVLSSQINSLKDEVNKVNAKRIKTIWFSVWLLLALIISLIVNFIKHRGTI